MTKIAAKLIVLIAFTCLTIDTLAVNNDVEIIDVDALETNE